MERPWLSPSAFELACHLNTHPSRLVCWEEDLLMDLAGLTHETYRKALRELRDVGALTYSRRSRGNRTIELTRGHWVWVVVADYLERYQAKLNAVVSA